MQQANLLGSKPQKKRLQDQSIYERHNDQIMTFFWFILVVIQWNCVGETLNIIDTKDYSFNRLIIGVIGELIISIIFSFDFFFFKKNNYQSLEFHSQVYLGIEFLAGPVSLVGDIISLTLVRQLNIFSTIFRCSKALSVIQTRRVFKKVSLIIPKVKDMFLCLFCVFYLFTYVATYMYGDLFRTEYYFNNIGFSFFTMLQIMTLDGWGEIGRDVLRQQNMVSASFLILFVFIMAYFFWNLLIGFILEILHEFEQTSLNTHSAKKHISVNAQSLDNVVGIEQNAQGQDNGIQNDIQSDQKVNVVNNLNDQGSKIFSMNSTNKEYPFDRTKIDQSPQNVEISIRDQPNFQDEYQDKVNLMEKQEETFYESISFGTLYKRIVMVLYFCVILDSLIVSDLANINGILSKFLHVSTSLIYTIHTIFIYTQNTYKFQIERKHAWMMFFHILGGPIAFIFDVATVSIEGTIGIGGIFKLFKAFTATRETIMGAIMIFPTLLPAFLGIISIIFLLAMWSISNLKTVKNFWTDFNTSVYTFVQILTLDDWAANIIKELLVQDKYFTPLMFVGFIFVANYFFLNMMVAISCETFKKVSTEDYVYRKQNKRVDFYEQEETKDGKLNGSYDVLKELYQDLEVIKDTHLNHEKLALIKDIGEQKVLQDQEQNLYQLLLEAKNGQISLNSPVTFTLNGKTIQIKQRDLVHLKFNLCNSDVEEGVIESSQQV